MFGVRNRTKSERLLVEIVQKRQKMVQLGEEKGLTNEETVTCSQELDQLLLVYQKQRLKEEEEKTSFATLISRFLSFLKL
ncbi:aspartyl-phosphate phosphatase Spo0E family protein [Priestia megaterium]|uniref:aspartyl-phosphate phosphatase Spo0E family protein n=1 Tax=Priestia TaxID=2800373 RepID=UPI002E209F55|nr:aspartyl-phosphate phosphatase Spo0E family protein [Priestia aryabhattai]MED4023398.1 aspartyl-phosphate phosphatase Spo0E family protein [Priestia aryabhattai]